LKRSAPLRVLTFPNTALLTSFDVDCSGHWGWGCSRYALYLQHMAAFTVKEDKPVYTIPLPYQCDRSSPDLEVVEVLNELPVHSQVKQQIGMSVVRNVNCVSWVGDHGVQGGRECLTVSQCTETRISHRHISWYTYIL
jgi:hypothetical protein